MIKKNNNNLMINNISSILHFSKIMITKIMQIYFPESQLVLYNEIACDHQEIQQTIHSKSRRNYIKDVNGRIKGVNRVMPICIGTETVNYWSV